MKQAFFMSGIEIMEVMKTIKTKNSEGYDRILQRILVDGANILIGPLGKLFEKIYNHGSYRKSSQLIKRTQAKY